MFPQKISQNIDILARIHGNVFPWQPTIMGNKASYYKSMFQISLPWLYLSFHNACPRHLKSRRDLLYHFRFLHQPTYECLITLFSKATVTSKTFIALKVFTLKTPNWFCQKAHNLPFVYAKFCSSGSSCLAST